MENPTDVIEQVENPTEATETASKSEVLVIPRALFNNILIAAAFFVFGALGAMLLNTQSASAHRAEHQELINQAVTAALAERGDTATGNTPGSNTRFQVSVDDDPAWGPEDAPVTIVEFSDFQCPFCGRFHQQTYPRLRETYGDRIRFVYRDFPILQLHPNALISAQAANCANEQGKYWEYHDLLLTNQDQSDRTALSNFAAQLELNMTAFDECLDSGRYEQEVNADTRAGSGYGVTGTPTFFINGRPLVGAQPYEVFAAMIDEELAAANQ